MLTSRYEKQVQLRFIRRFAPHPSGQLKLFNASLLSVRQPPATDGAGTVDRVPGHIIMLFLDGVYTETKHARTRFLRTNGPEQRELIELVYTISQSVAGFLERDEDDCMDAGARAKTVTLIWMMRMRWTPCNRYWGVLSATELQWGHSAETESKPDPVPRRVRTQQPIPY
jgi:hypothetical protein